MAQATQKRNTQAQHDNGDGRSEDLRDSPMMARLMDEMEEGTDVGHYGRLVFAMIARHFLGEDELVRLLSRQPDQDEEKARAMVLQVNGRDYNPPKRERLLEWQAQQEFKLIPDESDLSYGNLYRELKFPDGIYEHIQEFYEERAEAKAA